jgi:hypothetical protein
MLLLAFWKFYDSFTTLQLLLSTTVVVTQHVRISFDKNIGQTLPTFHLQLFSNGCPLDSLNEPLNASWHLLQPVSIDGYAIGFTNASTCGIDLKFRLETMGSQPLGSVLIGAAAMRWTAAGPRALPHGLTCPARVAFDRRPPWPLFLADGSLTQAVISIAGLLSVAACAAAGRHGAARWVAVAATGAAAAAHLVAGAGYLSLGMPRDALLPFVAAAALATVAAALAADERRFPAACASAGVAHLVARATADAALFGDAAYLTEAPPAGAAAAAALGLGLALASRAGAAAAALRVARWRRDYDSAWARAAAADSGGAGLGAIRAEVRAASQPCAARIRPPAHLARCRVPPPGDTAAGAAPSAADAEAGRGAGEFLRRSSSGGGGGSGSGWPAAGPWEYAVPATENGTADAESPIRSLDQLYTQACGERERERERDSERERESWRLGESESLTDTERERHLERERERKRERKRKRERELGPGPACGEGRARLEARGRGRGPCREGLAAAEFRRRNGLGVQARGDFNLKPTVSSATSHWHHGSIPGPRPWHNSGLCSIGKIICRDLRSMRLYHRAGSCRSYHWQQARKRW